jgi:hypothetical protein
MAQTGILQIASGSGHTLEKPCPISSLENMLSARLAEKYFHYTLRFQSPFLHEEKAITLIPPPHDQFGGRLEEHQVN